MEAANRYYTFSRVPSFWQWMAEKCVEGVVTSASMVKAEIEWPTELVEWIADREAQGFFVDVSSPESGASSNVSLCGLSPRDLSPNTRQN